MCMHHMHMQAADILIDEGTEVEACAALSQLLGAECDAVLENPRHQALLSVQVRLLHPPPWPGHRIIVLIN